jgi:hypothetical protein
MAGQRRPDCQRLGEEDKYQEIRVSHRSPSNFERFKKGYASLSAAVKLEVPQGKMPESSHPARRVLGGD